MKNRKFFYLIEPLDIDGDKQSDGFLISQYKIDKYNNKIFTKNKYITFKDFKKYASKYKSKKEKKGGLNNMNTPQNNEIVFLTKEQFNQLLNNQALIQKNFQYQQQPPPIIVQGQQQSSFGSSFASGLGGGLGFGLGEGLMDGLFDM